MGVYYRKKFIKCYVGTNVTIRKIHKFSLDKFKKIKGMNKKITQRLNDILNFNI